MRKRAGKKAISEKIVEKRGNLSAVARAFGRSRTWLYNVLNDKYPELWDVVEDARESLIDDAESELQKQMFKGNIAALIFFLKTQDKKRGYVERQEYTGKDGQEIVINLSWDNNEKV
jgi:hypothetical protein